MAIFPSRMYRLDQGPYKPEDQKQGGTQQVRSRGGFMGAFQRKSLPRTLQVIGATLQQMDNPQGQLDQFGANEERERALQMAQQAQDRTQQQNKQQQGAMEQAIASLPPEQQAWARLNPEAFMRAYVESQMDTNNGWNVGQGYSHAFRVNPDGTLQQGAALPLRPRAPITGYMWPAPDGTQYTDDLPEDYQ